ncbi:MAG: tol-pal system protein YbgF [Desulfobacteraceae bacterium]|nr:MAG: tol-pal system protein YbgF [Desulfobacteraceae bacterium]
MNHVRQTRCVSVGVLLALIAGIGLSGCATRRDVTTIDTRISEIELRDAEERRRREEFARSREATEQALRQQAASTRAQIDEVREEVRALGGRIEEIQHALRQQGPPAGENGDRLKEKLTRLDEQNTHIAQRLQRIEEHLKIEPPAAPGSRIKPEVSSAKAASEAELYTKARQAFEKGDTATARKGFDEFLMNYPSSDNADNAQFWVGETFFQEKQYEKAILEYQKVIEKYPRGNKVPAALLKQGLAFLGLKDRVNSRLIFEEVVRKYPNTSEAKTAAEKLKELR